MLAALERSREAQRQLVADASHELRTPLTSLRTNVELLERARELPPDERAAVVTGVRGQLEELTVLVGDLVDLARPGEQLVDEPEDLRLDELVAAALERARGHADGGVSFSLKARPCLVRGSRARLHRAVSNLLDNAVKWTPPGGAIEVAVGDGEVTVRDHGPGIPGRTCPTSSTASTARRVRAVCPARASASRSCARWPMLTAARSPPRTPRAAARACG
jgi:two-component system, OmpR family, sensor histidine kinase MprB